MNDRTRLLNEITRMRDETSETAKSYRGYPDHSFFLAALRELDTAFRKVSCTEESVAVHLALEEHVSDMLRLGIRKDIVYPIQLLLNRFKEGNNASNEPHKEDARIEEATPRRT